MGRQAISRVEPVRVPAAARAVPAAATSVHASRASAVVALRRQAEALHASSHLAAQRRLAQTMNGGAAPAAQRRLAAAMIPAQRTLLPPDGSAPDRATVTALFDDLAQQNPQVLAMRDDPTVQVFVNVARTEEGGDARTTAQWDDANARSFILIDLDMAEDETASDIQASLLHEILLHAVPAYERHVAAAGGDPDYADAEVGEERFDLEEAAEHQDAGRWQQVIDQGLRHGEDTWVETGKDLVRHLGVENPLGRQVCYLLQAYDPDFAELYLEDEESGSDTD